MAEESTTPDLVERVRAIFEVLNQLDWDALLPHYAPDACWDATATLGTTFDGHHAMRGLWQDWPTCTRTLHSNCRSLSTSETESSSRSSSHTVIRSAAADTSSRTKPGCLRGLTA